MTNLSMRAGETLTMDSAVTNADGSPRDITGASVVFLVWDSPSLGTLILTGAGSVTDGPAGDFTSYILDSLTDTYAGQRHVWYYRITLIEVSGTETVVEDGRLVVQ